MTQLDNIAKDTVSEAFKSCTKIILDDAKEWQKLDLSFEQFILHLENIYKEIK